MANAREITKGFSYIHANQVFNSTNTSVFINEYFIPDVVTLSYTIASDKTPIYSYNSEYFTSIAAGNFIVQGTLGILFKETAYLEVLRQKISNIAKSNDVNNINTLETIDKINNSPFIKTNATEYKLEGLETLSIYDNENYIYIPSKSGIPTNMLLRLPYGESSYYNDYTDENYEKYFSELENVIWGSNSNIATKGYAPWDPFSVRLRNDIELDYTYTQTSDRFVRGIMCGYKNPITIYVVYGDPNNPKSEYTIESIDDVHFRNRTIQITNDGNPIIALYEFIGRNINSNINHNLILDYFKEV